MKRFRTPIIIFFMIIVLFLSFFVFPLIGYMIGMGYNFEWEQRYTNSLILSGTFILIWAIVLFVAVKTKSKLLFGMYKYYWLAVVGACIFAVLSILLDVNVLLTFLFFLAIFFMIPIHGIGSLLVIVGLASPRDDLTIFFLFVAVIILLVGVFVKRKFLSDNNTTNGEADTSS